MLCSYTSYIDTPNSLLALKQLHLDIVFIPGWNGRKNAFLSQCDTALTGIACHLCGVGYRVSVSQLGDEDRWRGYEWNSTWVSSITFYRLRKKSLRSIQLFTKLGCHAEPPHRTHTSVKRLVLIYIWLSCQLTWKSVFWSNESKFEIFGSNRHVFVRHRECEWIISACVVPTVKHGGGGVMVLGCFAGDTDGDLFIIEGILNQQATTAFYSDTPSHLVCA